MNKVSLDGVEENHFSRESHTIQEMVFNFNKVKRAGQLNIFKDFECDIKYQDILTHNPFLREKLFERLKLFSSYPSYSVKDELEGKEVGRGKTMRMLLLL